MNLKKLLTKSLMLLTIILLGHLAVSCSDTETTDSSNFTLHYYGVTDIGPSMSYDLQAPSYIGGEPYDFAITNVTLNGESHTSESFTIDETTGEIHIQNTANLNTGLYSISVSCYSNGNYFEFKDAVKVNMLLAVPEGISVTPEEVLVKLDETNWEESSAQVSTEETTHVSIIGYAIAEDESKEYLEYFDISKSGKITIKSKHKNKLIPGEKYTLNLKLTTKAGEHLYPDAVTFNVVSKPRNLLYTPNSVQVEKGAMHESEIPSILGSKDDIKYAIKSITPATQEFTINETTGQIRLAEGNSLKISDIPYIIDITVSNQYGSSDFKEAYTTQIVPFITPIDPNTFSYADASIFEGAELTQNINDGFIGSAATFKFDANNSDEIQTQINKKNISINASTGAITISANNTLECKTYEIKVQATNAKPEFGSTTFMLTIKSNPNNFTFISYGTNLEHGMPAEKAEIVLTAEPEKDVANQNQFRYINRTNFPKTLEILKSDLPNNSTVTFEIIKKYPEIIGGSEDAIKFLETTIDGKTGTISLVQNNSKNNPFSKKTYDGGILLIKVTASGNDAPTITKTIPVFFSTPKKVGKNETMFYNPFVIKANPRTGECTSADCKVIGWDSKKFTGYKDISQLVLDYRAEHAFYDFSGNPNHGSGNIENNAQLLMYQVWKRYQDDIGLGSKVPMSYYLEKDKLAQKPAYIIPKTYQIKINPDKWIGTDGEYANGAVIAQIKYRLDNKVSEDELNEGNSVFPVIIWLDENF